MVRMRSTVQVRNGAREKDNAGLHLPVRRMQPRAVQETPALRQQAERLLQVVDNRI